MYVFRLAKFAVVLVVVGEFKYDASNVNSIILVSPSQNAADSVRRRSRRRLNDHCQHRARSRPFSLVLPSSTSTPPTRNDDDKQMRLNHTHTHTHCSRARMNHHHTQTR